MTKVCVVGLGYVGLPLAHALAKAGHTVHGFDINARRIEELKKGNDWTNELSKRQLAEVSIDFSADSSVIEKADVVILAIPTPVDERNIPDLKPVISASQTVGKHLKKGMIVVYESTVYPGTTEEICGPVLEKESGLRCGKDFTLGYSPERVNPGDKEHTIDRIAKIVSGQDEKTGDTLCDLYGSFVKGGIHRAPNIKTAEMAKAIENAQRDLNIAFVNEIALLCRRIGIITSEVLCAAGTKWNFLKFSPGLVGGHCIGVDPYYLVEKAKQLGMQTHVIAAGRAVNDGMAREVASQVQRALPDGGRRILVLGLTFKQNVPDTRNSKAPDVARFLSENNCEVEVHDPFLSPEAIKAQGFSPGSLEHDPYDAIVLLVPHKEYLGAGDKVWLQALKEGGLFYDLKSVMDRSVFEDAGRKYVAL